MRGRSRDSLTSRPSNLVITSPTSRPAGLAGPLSSMPATSAPRAVPRPSASAVASSTFWMRTPSQPRRVSPNSRSWSMIGCALADGTAKPMPTEPPVGDRIAVLMPITSPVHVEERAAGIALVDGRVGLDVVVVGSGLDVAAAGRDDAGRDRAAEAERVADRHHPVARPHVLRVAERARPSAASRASRAARRGRSWSPCRRSRPSAACRR